MITLGNDVKENVNIMKRNLATDCSKALMVAKPGATTEVNSFYEIAGRSVRVSVVVEMGEKLNEVKNDA